MRYIQPLNEPAGNGYSNGNPQTGVEGSIIPAQAIEHPQREIVNVIRQAYNQSLETPIYPEPVDAAEPDESELTQLYHAIRQLACPAGQITIWGGSIDNIPKGFLICDGQAVSRSTYVDLFAALGIAHGGGDGSTTFNLPDLQDRFVLGRSATRQAGSYGGSFTQSGSTDGHQLTIAEMPRHDHKLRSSNRSSSDAGGFGNAQSAGVAGRNWAHPSHNGTANWYSRDGQNQLLMESTGNDQTHSHSITNLDVTNPYYTLIYIIRT